MAFSKLNYTKDWRINDAEKGFLSVETDETKVREDQQFLFEEVKAHVNKVADELDAEKQRCEDTYATQKALTDAVVKGVTKESVTIESLSQEVKDRSYTKDETWTAETKAEYGMEAGAVPDAALAALAPLLHNWWAKKADTEPYRVETFDEPSSYLGHWADETSKLQLYCADSYALDGETGNLRLLNADQIRFGDVRDKKVNIVGKYVSFDAVEGLTRIVRWREDSIVAAKKTSNFQTFDIYAQYCDVLRAVCRAQRFSYTHRFSAEPPDDSFVPVGSGVSRAPGELRMAWGRPVVYNVTYYAPSGSSSDPETRTSKYVLDIGFKPVCIWTNSGLIIPDINFEGQDYYRDGMVFGVTGSYYFALGL